MVRPNTAVSAAAPAKTETKKQNGPALRPVLERLKDNLTRALNWQVQAGALGSAWLQALPQEKVAQHVPGLEFLAALGRDKNLAALKQGITVVDALIEARWTPPAVKVAAGRPVFEVGAAVVFREYYLQWGLERGLFTKAETETLTVTRVQKDIRKGKEDQVWITCQSTGSKFPIGPLEGSKFKLR